MHVPFMAFTFNEKSSGTYSNLVRDCGHSLSAALTTIRYDTRCYFNVRSKADISQLNLLHKKLNLPHCDKLSTFSVFPIFD